LAFFLPNSNILAEFAICASMINLKQQL